MPLTKNCPVTRFAQALEVKGPFGGAQGQVQMVNVNHHDLFALPFAPDPEIVQLTAYLACRFCACFASVEKWNTVLTAPTTTTPAIAVPV